MIVFDHFGLFVPQVFRYNPFVGKSDPIGKIMKLLIDIGNGSNELSDFYILDKLKAERSPNGSSQFPESKIELILPAVCASLLSIVEGVILPDFIERTTLSISGKWV